MNQLIISVHGIRTFGNWQERLERLLYENSSDRRPTVINYKFGYFSLLAFMVPLLRFLVVRRFRRFFLAAVNDQPWDRIDLVGHSFGTHVIAWGLYGIDSAARPPVNTIVLAGSVLKSGFPWQTLIGRSVKRVVNDCGTKDAVLILNQIFVLGTGMAGRLGFNGGIGSNFRNRYFDCGHSGFFLIAGKPNDEFIRRYWIPLLLTDHAPEPVDMRQAGALSGVKLWLLNNSEPIKLAAYLFPLVLLSWHFLSLAKEAKTQQTRAEHSLLTAQSLFIHFGDLVAEKIKPIARLDTVDSLLEEATVLVDSVQGSDPGFSVPYAGVLLTQARIKWEAGKIEEMRNHASKAIERLEGCDQSKPEVQHLLGSAFGWLALSYSSTDPEKALGFYDKGIGLLEQLVKSFKEIEGVSYDWRWLRTLAKQQQSKGDLLLDQFCLVREAAQLYEQTSMVWEEVRRERQDDPEVALEIAWAKNKQADLFRKQGDNEQALRLFKNAESGIEAFVNGLAIDPKWLFFQSIVQNNIGLVLRDQDNYRLAMESFEKAKTNSNKLMLHDSGNKTWESSLAWTFNNIGETKVRWARKEKDESLLQGAKDDLEQALNHYTALAQNTDNPQWKVNSASCKANIAAYEGTKKELAGYCIDAASDFVNAARVNPSTVKGEHADFMILRIAEFHEWAGLAYRNAGKADDADDELNLALKIIREFRATPGCQNKAFDTIRERIEEELQERGRPLRNPESVSPSPVPRVSPL